jgi:hypothetical protein
VRVAAAIRREMPRRAAAELVNGPLKAERRIDRSYVKGRDGDRINVVLRRRLQLRPAAALLAGLLRALVAALFGTEPIPQIA